MNFDWQTNLALACVAAAAVAVAFRLRDWASGTRASGCGSGCGNCPANKEKPLVQIELRKHS